MTNKIILNKERYIKPTEEEKAEILRLNGMFFDNDHKLLRGGTIKKKDRDMLNSLYYKFFKGIDNKDWSGSILDEELRDLKKDGICKNNSNKRAWSQSIVLEWYATLAETLTAKDIFYMLGSRKSMQRMVQYFYKVNN